MRDGRMPGLIPGDEGSNPSPTKLEEIREWLKKIKPLVKEGEWILFVEEKATIYNYD